MSILKSLKLTTAQPVRTSNDPVERARNKVVAALAEQKAMAEAKIAGQHFAPTHMVWRSNEDGQRVQVEAPKRLRAGWFVDAGGQISSACAMQVNPSSSPRTRTPLPWASCPHCLRSSTL